MEYALIPSKQDWFARLAAKHEQRTGSQLATASCAGDTLRNGCSLFRRLWHDQLDMKSARLKNIPFQSYSIKCVKLYIYVYESCKYICARVYVCACVGAHPRVSTA